MKAAGVKTWAFGIAAGGALLALVMVGLIALRSHHRRANQCVFGQTSRPSLRAWP